MKKKTPLKDFPLLGKIFWNLYNTDTGMNILVSGKSEFMIPRRNYYEVLVLDYISLLIGLHVPDEIDEEKYL